MLCKLLKNWNVCLLYDAVILLLGIPKKWKHMSIKKTCTDVYTTLFVTSQTVSNPIVHKQVNG